MANNLSNSSIDTLAAAVPSPYGPLTRVTDAATLPTPNYQIAFEFTSALNGLHVWLTPEQLGNAAVTNKVLVNYFNVEAQVRSLKTRINALNTMVNGYTAGSYTAAQYQALIQYIFDNFPEAAHF